MGRIKTMLIKRTVNELIEKDKKRFKNTFEENKKIVGELVDVPSKKLRNIIAGYITSLMKQQNKK